MSTPESVPTGSLWDGKIGRRGVAMVAGALGAAVVGASALPARANPRTDNGRPRFRITTSVTDFGAVGDGTTDATQSIQEAIDDVAAQGGGVVSVPAGSYRITAPLELKSEVYLVGDGEATRIEAPNDVNFGSGQSMIRIMGRHNCGVRSMTLDQGATGRDPFENKVSHSIHIAESSRDVDIEDVTFIESGWEPGSGWPTGPVVFVRAHDDEDPIERVAIRECTFIQSPNLQLNFAIRVMTDWSGTPNLTARCTQVAIENCHFQGPWGWNTIEFAGPGTGHSSVIGCTFEGVSFTHIDFDKGTHDCIAAFNQIKSAAKPPHLIENPNTRVATINDHGNYNGGVGGFRNANNIIAYNIINDTVTEDGVDVKEAAITIAFCTSSLVVGNQIRNVNNGGRGGGIHIQRDVRNCAIRDNYVRDVKYGIWFDDNFADFDGIRIEGNQIESTSESIYVNKLPGHGKDFVISGNQLMPAAGATAIALEPDTAEAPIIALNTTEGGAAGIRVANNDAVLQGNVVKRAEVSYEAADATRAVLIGNVSLEAGTADLESTGSAPSLVGNIFHGPQVSMGAPTTYATEAPTSGTWTVGSRVYHSEPAAGEPLGWICVAEGSPGQWESLGTIGA